MPPRAKDTPPPDGPDQVPGARHPRETTTLHGHGAAERQILEAMDGGHMPHAWLIGGGAGIGKATLAYRMAKAVLAPGARTGADTLATDPEHPAIRRILSEGHGDLFVLRRMVRETTGKVEAAIPVDAVRRLQRFFSQHASEGGWRVAVIDAADDLNRSSANALLKILEEPPAQALLVLIAHAPARVLPTVRSRCRRLQLKALGPRDVAAVLADHGVTLPEDRADLIAHLADGSAGQALRLADGPALDLYRTLNDMLLGLPQLDAARLHAFVDKAAGGADETLFATVLGFFETWVARLIRTAATGMPGPGLSTGEQDALRALAQRRPLDAWLEAWDKLAPSLAAGVPLNLDRKQLLLTAITGLQATARGA